MAKKPQYDPEEIRFPKQKIVESALVPEMVIVGLSAGLVDVPENLTFSVHFVVFLFVFR